MGAKHNTTMATVEEETTLQFYAKHGVEDIQQEQPFRFVRFHPSYDTKESLRLLQEELAPNARPRQVPWLTDYYALPSEVKLSQLDIWQTGRVYGQDVSSGAAVKVLLEDPLPSANEPCRILDLCCCPGLKLCAIADALQTNITTKTNSNNNNVIIGVDVSESRMNVCKKVLQKYQIANGRPIHSTNDADHTRIRLYCNDGTTFGKEKNDLNLIFDSTVARKQLQHLGKRKRLNKSARARVASLLQATFDFDGDHEAPIKPFDRVLVDAECTTDGSIIHMQKRKESAWHDCNEYCNEKLKQEASVVNLQKKLILRGFELLKVGGYMVYSTCSLSEKQNEDIVRWLLDQTSSKAIVVPVVFEMADTKLLCQGTLAGTLRFVPVTSDSRAHTKGSEQELLYGGGFFLAKIKKVT